MRSAATERIDENPDGHPPTAILPSPSDATEGDGKMQGNQLPKRLSQKSARKLLEADGWIQVRGGKHVVKMTKKGRRPITLPHHKGQDWSPGLTNAILKQAGLK